MKFGSLNFDNDGDTMLSSDAIYLCKNFAELNLSLTNVDVFGIVQTNWKALEP